MGIEYIDKIVKLIKEVETHEGKNILEAASKICKATLDNKSIYIFGASHAGILSQEAFYRAGGLININPIFAPEVSVDRSPLTLTSRMERLVGYGETVAESVGFEEGDILIVHSVSGRNPVTIEMANTAKLKGVYVIGITNMSYSEKVTSRHPSGKKMYDLCDIVIDNHGEIGDACISLENAPQKVAPTSTVIGATILNSIFSEAAKLVSEETDEMIPVFASANMDHGDDFNKKLFDKYRKVIHYKY